MKLRLAAMSDAEKLWTWRNDPLTRAMSLNSAEVPWSDHVTWLARTIASSSRVLLVAEVAGEPVGTVRIDMDGETEMSWTVAPEHRGKGFGTAMVQAAVPTTDCVAWIKAANLASRRIAERAGFELADAEARRDLHRWVRPAQRAVAAR